jgi:hypothetical protein
VQPTKNYQEILNRDVLKKEKRKMLSEFWIRLSVGYLEDIDFQQLPNETKWHYIAMYLLAKKSDAGGLLAANNKPLDAKGIAWLLNDNVESISKSIKLLSNINFLSIDKSYLDITNYDDEQSITIKGKESEDRKEKDRIRQEKHRNKIKKTKEEIDIKTETKKEKEIKTDIDRDIETEKEIDTDIETEEETDIETETEGGRDKRDVTCDREAVTRDTSVTERDINQEDNAEDQEEDLHWELGENENEPPYEEDDMLSRHPVNGISRL